MAISAPGIGSSLDVSSLVSQLMSVERQPLSVLTARETSFQTKLSAYGTLKGALAALQTGVKDLGDANRFQALTATVGDATVFGAMAHADASPGNYRIEVFRLAQAQKLASAGKQSATDAVGSGTVTFDFGTINGGSFDPTAGKYSGASFVADGAGARSITIDASNNSLTGIRDAINQANLGITATIVNDGSSTPYRLALTSARTGADASMRISVAGDAALAGLLAHDPAAAQALAETSTAQDARLTVDGISITSPTNSVTEAIPGVTLNLLKANAGTPATLTVARDAAQIKASVSQFAKAFNDANKTLSDLSSYDPATRRAGPLNGDSTVGALRAQLRRLLTTGLAGTSGEASSLSRIGVSFQKDGTLAVDATRLQSAIDKQFEQLAAVFAATGKATDSLVGFVSGADQTRPGSYPVTVTQLASQASTAGTAAAGLTITAGANDTLSVLLDGNSSTVTLSPGSYASADALAAELQSKINGTAMFSAAGASVTVTQAGGVLKLASTRFGSDSVISVSGSARATLLGASTTDLPGRDVAGTINGVAAKGNGKYLTGAIGDAAEGLRIEISGGPLGGRGTVNYMQGYAYQLDKLVGKVLETGGVVSARAEGINATLKTISRSKEDWNERLTDIEKRYRARFTALDTTIGNLQKTSAYLQQQLANLPKIS